MARRLRANQWMAVLSALGFFLIHGISSPQAQDLLSLGEVKSAYEAGGQRKIEAIELSNGLMWGFMTANAALEQRGDAELFCVPAKLLMDGELLYRQTLTWSADVVSGLDYPYAVATFWALQEAFPCD